MGSISGAFALAAFVAGLFCRRLRTALIIGGVLALLYALLVIIGLWDLLADANLPYLFGALLGACLVIVAAGILAFYMRRSVVWLVGRLRSH
jgi:hypothetical protein